MSEQKKQTKKEELKKTKTTTKKEITKGKAVSKKKKPVTAKTASKKRTAPKTLAKKVTNNQEKLVTVTPIETEKTIETAQPVQEEISTQPAIKEEPVSIEKKGFFSLYFSTWKKIFSTKGRANRTEVFLFPIVNSFVILALNIIAMVIDFFFSPNFFAEQTLTGRILIILSSVFAIMTLPATITLLIRRFHDFSKSGLFAFMPYLCFIVIGPIALFIMSTTENPIIFSSGFAIVCVLWMTAFIWTLMYLFRPGTKGENKYGEKPQTKTRIIWLSILVFVLNVILYTGLGLFFTLIKYPQMLSNPASQSLNIYNPTAIEEPVQTLSDEEFEAEILKMEKFINSLPDENAPVSNTETIEKKSPMGTKNLLKLKD
ncbi:MAG: DUF805 domain-containing protein [Alphaproteobacteria bacterium]|nr:DUF805 domain-containing protein [Alphaproteobacteria bacterium]